MTEKKDHPKEFSTCLEDFPCAEMMHKMLGRNGISSLCADMLKKMREHHGEADSYDCAERLRSMMKGFDAFKAEPHKAQKEEGHVKDK